MNKKLPSLLALIALLAIALGCGFSNPLSEGPSNTAANRTGSNNRNANANRSLTDVAVDTAVGEQKIGVPECDEVMDLLTTYANNPEDNFAVRAAKGVFVNKIKESIRQSIEQNQTDKADLSRVCKEAKTELEKYRSQEGAPKN